MAIKGQKFTLDLDADNFQFDVDQDSPPPLQTFNVVREITERETTDPPPPPRLKSKSGFPEHHRPRNAGSRFKQQQQQQQQQQQHPDRSSGTSDQTLPQRAGPSDRAIAHHIGKKYGFDTEAKEKAQISEENKNKLAKMTPEEIQQARDELMSGLNPALIQRLLSRANIEEDQSDQHWDEDVTNSDRKESKRSSVQREADVTEGVTAKKVKFVDAETEAHTTDPPNLDIDAMDDIATRHPAEASVAITEDESDKQKSHPSNTESNADTTTEVITGPSDELSILDQDDPPSTSHSGTTMHFPVPPRDAAAFPELDPDSETFLEDLRQHYFPDTPHDPNNLTWLQDPTEEEKNRSAYAPTQHAYAPSDIRFDFAGRLIPPSESENIPSTKGLHHHGEASNSAGYTIPELAMLCRSTLPNQRCLAYQTLGRILYRLGRGDFGPKGTELHEGLWSCIEHERPLEVIMSEANRKGGHMSAKTYATEALWLWRKGGGGDRGLLKQGQKVVR